jgi:GNAT superfamily N-acetyltransferase
VLIGRRMSELTVARPDAADKPEWRRLYEGYATFYKMPMSDAIADRVWDWLNDPQHVLEGLVARDRGRVVGLAHFRAMPRPLTATMAGFLDDLFVHPGYRGQRVADRLIGAIGDEGRKRGWTIIRWITADDNYRARGVYDRTARRTHWITYQIDL